MAKKERKFPPEAIIKMEKCPYSMVYSIKRRTTDSGVSETYVKYKKARMQTILKKQHPSIIALCRLSAIHDSRVEKKERALCPWLQSQTGRYYIDGRSMYLCGYYSQISFFKSAPEIFRNLIDDYIERMNLQVDDAEE